MKKICFLAATLLLTLANATPLWAWGVGHRAVGMAVAQRLPSPWKEKLTGETLTQFLHDNAYPDSRDALEPERWGEENVKFLNDRGIRTRFDFHQAENRAHALELLVHSIRKQDDARVFLLLAILAHTIADQTACNHDPVVQLATYGWGAEGMRVAPNLVLDAGWLLKQDRTWQIFEAELARHSFADENLAADDVFLRVMSYDWEGTDGLALGITILQAASELEATGDAAAERTLAEALAYLAAWGVERTVKTFVAAERLARDETPPAFDPISARERFREYVAEFQTKRPISTDSFVVPFLPREGAVPEVVVLNDPTGRFDSSMFASLDRVLSCMITATLREKYDAGIMDIREFLAHGLDVAKTKILVVSAARFNGYGILKLDVVKQHLLDFQRAGGKILWLGTRPPVEISDGVFANMDMNPEKPGYCRPVYPVPMDALMESRVLLSGTGQSWPFVRKPVGQAGWMWFGGQYFFRDTVPENVETLLELESPDGKRAVGFAYPQSEPRVVWLPTYAVFPYVLTSETPQLYPTLNLRLDSAGRAILYRALDRLELPGSGG